MTFINPLSAAMLGQKLSGRILLQVKERGQAWYVSPDDYQRYYISDGNHAYGIMYSLGLGISNIDIQKIPIGILKNSVVGSENSDEDNDGLEKQFEEAVGTDDGRIDSDYDGFSDKDEIILGYNPIGAGKMKIDLMLAQRLKGKILLQVESRGEAWYVNPVGGKRYYLKDGDSAYSIMSLFGLGISNEDLFTIRRGAIFIPYHHKTHIKTTSLYSISVPIGWDIEYEFPESIKFVNYGKNTLNISGDNIGTPIGDKVAIEFRYIRTREGMVVKNISDSWLAQQELDESSKKEYKNLILDFESISHCNNGQRSEKIIDNVMFYECKNNKTLEMIGKVLDTKSADILYFLMQSYDVNNNAQNDISRFISTLNFTNSLSENQ